MTTVTASTIKVRFVACCARRPSHLAELAAGVLEVFARAGCLNFGLDLRQFLCSPIPVGPLTGPDTIQDTVP